jgi:hypothetical protein
LNFIIEGCCTRHTYILILTDNEATVGAILGFLSAGMIGGGVLTIVWQGTRRRLDTIMPSLMFAALGWIVFGILCDPLALAVVAFIMALPYKMTNALLMSVMQKKIPPDMQGRVFAFNSQLVTFAMPITYLITGPIIDTILEPAVGEAVGGMLSHLWWAASQEQELAVHGAAVYCWSLP